MEATRCTTEALKKLEDQLTCAICLDSYKEPKLLQCFHVFCEKCLGLLVVQDRQGQLSVLCPTCRRSTLLPAASVSGLQSAFHIHHLFEIQEAFEKNKESQATTTDHAAQAVSADDSEKPLPPKKSTFRCPFHKERELELYCETCEELICFHCTVRLHNGHQYDLVSEVFEKHKSEITESLEPVEKQLGTVSEALEQLDTRCEQFTDQRAAIEADIHKTFRHLHETLDVRRTELIGQLNLMTQQKMKTLAAQRDEIEIIQIQLKNCLEFVRESLRTGSQGEVMNMKKPVVTQIKKLTADFKPDTLKTTELADMKFIASEESIQQFGKVYLQQVSPEKCYVSTEGMQVEEETTEILHVVDQHGKPYVVQIPTMSVNCDLLSEITAKKTKCHTKQLENGRYEISYKPTTRGRHHLHIKVEGEHIKGSPFPKMVKLPVEKLCVPLKTIEGLKSPWGVAVNQRGEVIVAENDAHCISIFSPSGKKLKTFGSKGLGRGKLMWPHGVAVDADDNILVVECGNHRIQKFTSDSLYLFVKTVGKKGSGHLQFSCPVGVAVHPHNNKVYVVDRSNHRIQILNSDLSFSSIFGSYGSANGQFQYPWDVAFDKTGNVYVVDSLNHCVQVFTAEGTFLKKIRQHGQGGSQLKSPTSIAIDAEDVIYVTESHHVSVFSSEGKFLTSFCTKGNRPGQFVHGIAVDKSGMIYVSDIANNCMQIF